MSEHHLNLRLRELLIASLVVLIFNLLLSTLDLNVLSLFVFGLTVIFGLLKDANLIAKLLEVLLLNDLIQVLFRERELIWVLLILILKVLQKKLFLLIVEFVQIH
jgi:hypothetical protein